MDDGLDWPAYLNVQNQQRKLGMTAVQDAEPYFELEEALSITSNLDTMTVAGGLLRLLPRLGIDHTSRQLCSASLPIVMSGRPLLERVVNEYSAPQFLLVLSFL